MAAWFLFGTDLWQRWEDRKFDQAVTQEASTEAADSEAAKDNDQAPSSDRAPQKSAGPARLASDVIGRLSIPRLKVRSVVREGATDGVLSLALGHIRGTALPGEMGNIGIAGHRDTLFRGLRNVSTRDRIVFETLEKKYVYQVTSTEIVPPSAVEVLQPGIAPELTLVTCYPFEYIGSAPERFIVKARLIEDVKEAAVTPVKPAAPASVPVSLPVPERLVAKENPQRVAFSVTTGHSRELIPGRVWFGVSGVDAGYGRLDGWLWVARSRSTIWLHDEDINRPVRFRSGSEEYALTVTRTAGDSVSGFLAAAKPKYEMKPMAYAR